MFELIAEGQQVGQRQVCSLADGKPRVLGRSCEADIAIGWDDHISRQHVRLSLRSGFVEVVKVSTATNPLFFDGSEVETCRVHDGETFVLGSTTFHIARSTTEPSSPGARPVEEVTFNRKTLEKVRMGDADQRIDVLTHLPEIIWDSRTDLDLHHRLVNLLLTGVLHADAVAIVELDDREAFRVLHWDRRRETAGEFRPSTRLVRDALKTRGDSVLHVWNVTEAPKADYTAAAECDWAFCTPVLEPPWGLYVAGRLDQASLANAVRVSDAAQLQSDVKFTELVAEIIRSLRRTIKLERQQSGLRQFFAPPILSALGDDLDTDLLEPRECDVTVMFCDLRGFSQQAEEAADDLIGLLERVGRALGVMTQAILKHGGVTGDFQGDAALGFWGWPFPSSESVLDACRAALEIRASFAETEGKSGHPLADFQMGIGIAHGRAVAGKIGTADQVKVTVFGPVVNLASRLEGMTKVLRVPILLDEATATMVGGSLDSSEGRTRRLAKLQPYGMETPLLVSELLPPAAELPDLTNAHIEQYERGVEHFITGRWEAAYACLHSMPASDRAQDFLTMLIAQHNRIAPPDWEGVVRLSAK